MNLKIISVIEEQLAVQFTGKINILSSFNRQFLGNILFKSGEIIQVTFGQQKGLKAFYQVMIQEYTLQSFDYVVEPEIVYDKERQIHYPYAVLKNKMGDVLKNYRDSLKFRPPENVKIMIDTEFFDDTLPVTSEEYSVLETLSEHNTAFDIYQHCQLLDHEITLALVGLRKKGALKIVGSRNNP